MKQYQKIRYDEVDPTERQRVENDIHDDLKPTKLSTMQAKDTGKRTITNM